VADNAEPERRLEERRQGDRREAERRRNWDSSAYERLAEWQRKWRERQGRASTAESDPDAKA
jgi:hypothetical protein